MMIYDYLLWLFSKGWLVTLFEKSDLLCDAFH